MHPSYRASFLCSVGLALGALSGCTGATAVRPEGAAAGAASEASTPRIEASATVDPAAAPTPRGAAEAALEEGEEGAARDTDSAARQAVRVDPSTFESTVLGTLRLGRGPLHRVEVIDGGDELRAMVAEINALEQITATRSDGTEVRIERSDARFLPVLEQHWLKMDRSVHLRVAPSSARAARRVWAWAVGDGKSELLGTLEIDAMDYLHVVGGPSEQRARLGRVAAIHNQKVAASIPIPPPAGREGKWGRSIERGTPEHFGLMRDEMLKFGVVIAPEGRRHFDSFVLAGSTPTGAYRWLTVHAGDGLVVVPSERQVVVHLAGPPGGPLSFRALSYSGVAYEQAALRAYAKRLHGEDAGYAEGESGEAEIAGRRLLAFTFRTGGGPAAAAQMIALWPKVRHFYEGDTITDEGVALELTTGGQGPTPKIADLLEDRTLSRVLDSLWIDL